MAREASKKKKQCCSLQLSPRHFKHQEQSSHKPFYSPPPPPRCFCCQVVEQTRTKQRSCISPFVKAGRVDDVKERGHAIERGSVVG